MDINSARNSQQSREISGITYGYIRVSTISQHDDRQRIAMAEFGITEDHIFVDKQSGKNFDRPAYTAMMAALKPGDTVVVKSLDRLGRSYEEMIHQLDIIANEKGAFIVVLDLPILDSRKRRSKVSFRGDGDAHGGAGLATVDDLTVKLVLNLVIQIFSYVAQLEREMNHQRTMEGIAAAKERGVKFGRTSLAKPAGYEDILAQWTAGAISECKAARLLGVSRPTFHKWSHE